MSVKIKDRPPEKTRERRKAPLWWRITRGTVRGTATVARIAYLETRYTYGVTKTKARARYKAWKTERKFTVNDAPEFDEVPRKRRRLGRTQYLCMTCGRKYKSVRGLNKHFESVHASEPLPRDHAGPVRVIGRDGTAKVWVSPPRTRSTTTTSSTRSANPMNSTIAQTLRAAWARMAEARPTKLSEIRDDMVGLEQVLGGSAGEAILAYRAHLVRNLHFDPVTVQGLVKANQHLEDAGKAFSAVIAIIEEAYAADIVAAKRSKGGAAPSTSTLAS